MIFITIAPLASITVTEPAAGSSGHILVHVDDYLLVGVHQAGLGAMGVSLNIASDKIVQRIRAGRKQRHNGLKMTKLWLFLKSGPFAGFELFS